MRRHDGPSTPSTPFSPTSTELSSIQDTSLTSPPTSGRPSPSPCNWSDIVPPNSGLTFAVVWDPEDEMVAFSSAELSRDSVSNLVAISPTDACSQVLTVGPSTLSPSENTATLQYFQDNHEWLFVDNFSRGDRLKLGRTQTSSTLGELDVYLRGSLMGRAHRNHRQFSCLEVLDKEFDFDPRTSFAKRLLVPVKKMKKDDDAVTDEGFYEISVHKQAKGRAGKVDPVNSATPPRTTGSLRCSKHDEDDNDSLWSEIEPPDLPPLFIHEHLRHRQKRLKKRRPAEMPASPSEVLQRDVFSHQVNLVPPPPPTPSSTPIKPLHAPSFSKLCRKLSTAKKHPVERWICIEVAQEVKNAPS